MIGGLQREFGDLDIKYIKQKYLKISKDVSRTYREELEKTAALCKVGSEILWVSVVG